MKKGSLRKAALFCTAILVSAMLAGCTENTSGETPSDVVPVSSEASSEDGSQSATGESTEPLKVTEGRLYSKDIDFDKYVTFKDYQNFRVERDPVEISEDEVEEILRDAYYGKCPENLGIKDRAVANGDTINLDYVGKKDGEAFDGGTAEGTYLTIGSNSYIDGFESGLVGVMPGKTVDLNLTFPEDYFNEDLAGQAVVFTVTVNYIIPEKITDEGIVGIVPDINTVEDLRQYIRDYLTQAYQEEGADAYREKILEAFLEEMCEVKEVPQEWIDYYDEQIRDMIVTNAFQMATDPESLIQNYFGQDLETFVKERAEITAREELVMQAIAKKEGLCIDDEELNKVLQEEVELYGFSSIAEYLGDNSMEDYREYYHYQKAMDYLCDLASKKSEND